MIESDKLLMNSPSNSLPSSRHSNQSVGSSVEEQLRHQETHPDTYTADDCKRTQRPALPDDDLVDTTIILLKGFADATRLRILCLLQNGEVCVHEIVDTLNITQSGVSHQLRILRNARLVKHRKEGRHVYYRLADDHIRTMLTNALLHGGETD